MEFEISDNGGKSKAINVTGPGGGYVQGAPRRARGARTLPSAALLSPLSPLPSPASSSAPPVSSPCRHPTL